MVTVKNFISLLIGIVLGILICYMSYRIIILPSYNKQLKQLQEIIEDQNTTIEKLGSIEKYNYSYDVKNKNDIKIKN